MINLKKYFDFNSKTNIMYESSKSYIFNNLKNKLGVELSVDMSKSMRKKSFLLDDTISPMHSIKVSFKKKFKNINFYKKEFIL